MGNIDPTEKTYCAYHEAGHAIMAVINRLPLRRVELRHDGGATLLSTWTFWFPWNKKREYFERDLEFVLAGVSAELLVHDFDEIPSSVFGSDSYHATRLARVHGFSLRDVRVRVNRLMREHRELVELVASKLHEKGSLSGEIVEEMARDYFARRPHLFPLVR